MKKTERQARPHKADGNRPEKSYGPKPATKSVAKPTQKPHDKPGDKFKGKPRERSQGKPQDKFQENPRGRTQDRPRDKFQDNQWDRPQEMPRPRPEIHIEETGDSSIVKGRHEVLELLRHNRRAEVVYVSDGAHGSVIEQILGLARKNKIKLQTIPSSAFQARFGDKSQGICARAASFTYTEFEELVASSNGGEDIIVALNSVEDPRNLGAIVRTVEAGGAKGLVIPRHRSAGMTDWAIATAQGAAEILPVSQVTNLGNALEELKKAGFWIIGLEEGSPQKYTDLNFSGRTVLVAGGENAGLGTRIARVCDDLVSIPLHGKTPSLNVSVSLAVVFFEALRQKATPKS